MDKETILEIIGMLDAADEYKELVEAIVKKLDLFLPILDDLTNRAIISSAKYKALSFNELIKEGFTREEAIILMVDSAASLKSCIDKISTK
jgi:hypothetical protein